jgi:hypothetical protein
MATKRGNTCEHKNEFKAIRSNMEADIEQTQAHNKFGACTGRHREPNARACHLCADRREGCAPAARRSTEWKTRSGSRM